MIQLFYKILKRSSLIWNFYFKYKFYHGLLLAFFLRKKIILSRSACLGQELILKVFPQSNFVTISQQKSRLDLYLKTTQGGNKLESGAVKSHLADVNKIYPWIQEQQYTHWTKVPQADLFVIDSLSELVDKEFKNKKGGWSFCCYGTDVVRDKTFNEEFESIGLLDLEKLEETYRAFFKWLEITHKNIPVIFIHYPTTLDDRALYKERYEEILRIMKKLESEKDHIYNLYVEEPIVSWAEDDPNHIYPYHYSKKTINEFVTQWENINQKINFTL